MDIDDVVIGSGMSALGVVLGLDPSRRVIVLAGPKLGAYTYYNSTETAPCAYFGIGGLGNDWHGVIPTGRQHGFGSTTDADFVSMFAHFYPHTEIRSRLGRPWLFVPWRPVRPTHELARLAQKRQGRLVFIPQAAQRFGSIGSRLEVRTAESVFHTKRIWVAAGALHSPALLERSLGCKVARGLVSDHVLCYIGQTGRQEAPKITRSRDGMFVPAEYGQQNCGLYTRRPARFAFKRLDYGIEQRAVFGLPTGSAVKKILRRMSPGLLAEAVYNRFGILASASTYTVYSQVLVRDAYALIEGRFPLTLRTEAVGMATKIARAGQPFDGLTPSCRPDIFIPGIHLHHSVDLDLLASAGVNTPGSPIQVVDASTIPSIGPDHHTFSMLLTASARAQNASN